MEQSQYHHAEKPQNLTPPASLPKINEEKINKSASGHQNCKELERLTLQQASDQSNFLCTDSKVPIKELIIHSPQTTDLDQKHERTLNQCQKKREEEIGRSSFLFGQETGKKRMSAFFQGITNSQRAPKPKKGKARTGSEEELT